LGCRLVQISATRLPEQIELTYSFDLDSRLTNLRLTLPGIETRLPSISSIYGCAILYENEIHDLFDVKVEGLAVDFGGNFYRTAVKFPFGSTQTPSGAPASSAASNTPVPAASTAPAK
jgi:ech hydrogenase subunit D